MDEGKLGTGGLLKLFFSYGIPAVIVIAVFSVYNIADGIFIGKAVGPEGLAAVSVSSPVLIFFACVAAVVGTGGNALVGIALGKGDRNDAFSKFTLAAVTVLALTVFFSLLLVVFARPVAGLVGANEEIAEETAVYLRTTGIFCFALLMSGFFGILMETAGKPVVAMLGNVAGVLINILLDYIFIMKLGMGLFGASLSNGIGSSVSLLIFLAVLLSPSSNLRFSRFRFDLRIIGKMLGSGMAQGIGALSSSVTALIFNIVIMRRLGPLGVAAFAVIQYCFLFISSVMDGASQGMQPIISYNHGAENFSRIKSALKLYTAANILLGFLCIAVLLVFRRGMFALFSDGSPELEALAFTISNIYCVAFLFYGLNNIYISYFSAVADIKRSVILSVFRVLVLKAGLILLLPAIFGDGGIWFATPVSEGLALILSASFIIKSQK